VTQPPSHSDEEEESKPSHDTEGTEPPQDTQEGETQPPHDNKEEEEEESKPSHDTEETEPSHDTKEGETQPLHDIKEEEESKPSEDTKEGETQPPQDNKEEEEEESKSSHDSKAESQFPVSRREPPKNEFRRPIDSEFMISRLALQIAPQTWRGRTLKQYSVSDFAEFLATSDDPNEPFIEHLKSCFTRLSLPITESPTSGDRSVTFWLRPPGQTIEIGSESKWSLCAIFNIVENSQVPHQLFTIGEGSFWHEVTVDTIKPLKTRPPGSYSLYIRDMSDDVL
jgi:hypothetical protein